MTKHRALDCFLTSLVTVLCIAVPSIAAEPASRPAGRTALSVSSAPLDNTFPVVTASGIAVVRIDDHDAKVVRIAADLLAGDIERVTGRKPLVERNAGPAPAAIIVGTLDAIVASGKLDVSAIRGKWEAFTLAIVANPTSDIQLGLVIAGSDRRGTAYGLMAISEAIGVSPWYWWADVPPKKQSTIYLSVPASFHDAPAVKYRGIFINDEDWGLNVWASKTFDPTFGNIGPKTYAKVFELMLRLRLNYIWPAMHSCSREFGTVPENVALADDYGIVAGASHCEPMLCNNVHWDEKSKGRWNYSTNREVVRAYWEENVKARADYEAVWTLGIRGIHDGGMQSPPKDTGGKLKLMGEVFNDQRALLEKYTSKQWGGIAQCFVPYKEVLKIYDAGLQVPQDVTLVWVDDNFGYIRRLSNPAEQKRPGGAGVYYHLSYYGAPHSYTWINTTAPALMWEELHKAWENNARTIWMLNVGDIKPMEIGVDYFARLAWDTERPGSDSQPQFLRACAFESAPDPRGASPLRANVLRPVTESNCVAARPGGEQLEVNDQSETQVNSIRQDAMASLQASGEAQTREGNYC